MFVFPFFSFFFAKPKNDGGVLCVLLLRGVGMRFLQKNFGDEG